MQALKYNNVIPFSSLSLNKGLTKFNVLEGSWRRILKKDQDRKLSDRELQLLWTLLRLSIHYQTSDLKLDYEFIMNECQFGCSQPQMRRYFLGLEETKLINYTIVKQKVGYGKKLAISIDLKQLKILLPSMFDEQIYRADLQGKSAKYYIKNKSIEKEIVEIPKYLSTISKKEKEKEKREKEEIEIETPKPSLLCYEAASNPSCLSLKSETEAKSRDEARKSESRPLAKVIPLTAAMEKRLYLERLNRFNENDKSEDTNAFMSVAGILDQIQVQEQTQEQEVNTTETATLAPMMTVDHAKELTQLPQENCGTEKSYPDLKGAITTIESTDQTIDQTTANNQEENNMSIPLKTTDNPLWNEIRQKALASTDDEWDLKYDLNQLEMIERNLDKPLRGLNGIEIRKEFEFRGSAFVIKNLKRKHFKIFTESIHALAPNHTFTFTEI